MGPWGPRSVPLVEVTVGDGGHLVEIEPGDWERCVGCGKEFWPGYICELHSLCGICHPDVDEAKRTSCVECGHGRQQHSRNGCVEPGCPCKVKYMDRDKFAKAG